MSSAPFHVVVIGGGIGGLCLAQGLMRAGVDVAVYERDRGRTSRLEGYRLNINPAGSRALHACLPPAQWAAFVATAGDPRGGFRFLTERLEELAVFDQTGRWGATTDPAESQHPVDRTTLRQVLLAGLDDVVHFDKKFERYERSPDGRVTAHFADGTSATGDVLVGADGVNSRVREQYLPQARRIEPNAIGVALKLPLTEQTRSWLPPRLASGSTMILTPAPFFLFTSVFERKQGWAETLDALGDGSAAVGLSPEHLIDQSRVYQEYILCAFTARRDVYPPGVHDLDGPGLQRVVERLIADWHPDLRRLVAEADPDSVMLVPYRASVPLGAWESTNVTLLGDAVHSMPPVGGLGANTALRDANLLCRKLTSVDRGAELLLPAIHDYEAEMREYGFDAVRAALRETRRGVSDNRIALAAFKTMLRVSQTIPPLKRMLLANEGEAQARPRPWEREHQPSPLPATGPRPRRGAGAGPVATAAHRAR